MTNGNNELNISVKDDGAFKGEKAVLMGDTE